ncbi:DUF421 domain-containing protein [Alloiococcus sp. CFN-8]|uniref:DUF421 domain-containing protein n=1 Tax=Alloiococcus sp. CFN-8 TaxID=3416081 RepID=UPI003CF271DF
MFVLIIRTIILFFIVVFVMRLMGKRQLGQLQPYELVITIMISELATLPMQDVRLPLLLGVIPILTMLILQIILSEVQLHFETLRKIIDGKPSILLRDGKLDTAALREQRINVDDLMEELRISGHFNFSDLAYIILENNGQLSIIPKAELAPVTKKDLNIPSTEDSLPVILILNGKVQSSNLKSINKSDKWLKNQIKNQKITNYEDIYLAMVDSNRNFYCQRKEQK